MRKENSSMGKTQNEKLAARKEKVDKQVAEMKAQGYALTDLSVDGNKANVMSILTGFLPAVILLLLFAVIHGWEKFREFDFSPVMFCFMLSVIVHEGIHGLFFGIFAKNHFKAIEFGVFWKSLNPYCNCSDPVKKGQYLTALLMPGIILGCCTAVFAFVTGNINVMVFSALNLFTAGGDFFIAYLILKSPKKGKDEWYMDHPTKPGVLVLAK